MSYGNGIKLTTGFDVGAKSPLDNKSVVETIEERDAFVTDNLAYEGLEVYVKATKTKYRYNGTEWINADELGGSGLGSGEGLTNEQKQQLTTAYEHSQSTHVSASDIPTKVSQLNNDSGFITSIPEEYVTDTELNAKGYLTEHQDITGLQTKSDNTLATIDKTVVGGINEVKNTADGKSKIITLTEAEYKALSSIDPETYYIISDDSTNISTTIDVNSTDEEVPSAKTTYTELNKKVNKTDIIDNLTSTDTNKPLSANQGKVLDDKKLNKADFDKIIIINADGVNIKDFILENCTDENKLYHITARSSCTDMPKVDTHYYMNVQKIGSFTTKVVAKELGSTNNEYVCTYRSDDVKWTNWEKVLSSSNISTTIDSTSTNDQIPSAKAVYDNIKNKNTIQPSDTITNYSTVFDWAVNNVGATCGYEGNNFTDCPLPNTWGSLVCIGTKVESGLKVLFYTNFNKDIYVRTIQRRNGVNAWVTSWQRICTTSVEDMSSDEIESFADTDVSGTINYRVKNGICFVKLWGVKSTKVGKTKFLLNNSSLPIPNCFDIGNALFEANGDGTATAFAFVDANGALIAHFYKANSEAYGSFSYPVKES